MQNNLGLIIWFGRSKVRVFSYQIFRVLVAYLQNYVVMFTCIRVLTEIWLVTARFNAPFSGSLEGGPSPCSKKKKLLVQVRGSGEGCGGGLKHLQQSLFFFGTEKT
jgi:hypothetical protein